MHGTSARAGWAQHGRGRHRGRHRWRLALWSQSGARGTRSDSDHSRPPWGRQSREGSGSLSFPQRNGSRECSPGACAWLSDAVPPDRSHSFSPPPDPRVIGSCLQGRIAGLDFSDDRKPARRCIPDHLAADVPSSGSRKRAGSPCPRDGSDGTSSIHRGRGGSGSGPSSLFICDILR